MRTVSERAFIETLENYFDERIVANRYRDEEKDVFRLAKTVWSTEKTDKEGLSVIEEFGEILESEAKKTAYYAAVMSAYASAKDECIEHLTKLLADIKAKETVEQEFINKMVYENGNLLVANNYTYQNDGKECSGGVYLFELNGEFYEQSFQDGKPDFYQKLSLTEAIESIKTSIHRSSVQEEYSISQEAYEIADVSFPEHDMPYSIKLANAWQEQVEKAEWELENLTEANAVATVIYEGITTARSSIYEANGEYYLSEHTENFTNGMITDESSLVTEEKAVELINAWREQVEENIHLSEIGEPLDMLISIKITDKGEQLLSDKNPKKNNRSQAFDR